jgi:hypothetical protein
MSSHPALSIPVQDMATFESLLTYLSESTYIIRPGMENVPVGSISGRDMITQRTDSVADGWSALSKLCGQRTGSVDHSRERVWILWREVPLGVAGAIPSPWRCVCCTLGYCVNPARAGDANLLLDTTSQN